MLEIFIGGRGNLPRGKLVNAAGMATTDVSPTQVHIQQTTPYQKPIPHSEHPGSPVPHRGICYVLSFNKGKIHFAHFGGSFTNIPADSHSRDSRGWEDRRGPRPENLK